MSHLSRIALRSLFTAAVALTLGFGATQAFAVSEAPAPEGRRCDPSTPCQCSDGTWGYCTSTGACVCE